MHESLESMRPRACAICDAPAEYRHREAGALLCRECGIYVAGQCHGKVTLARKQLADAIGDLLASGLTHEHVLATVDGELQAVQRQTGPDVAYPEDRRPWVDYLLEPARNTGVNRR